MTNLVSFDNVFEFSKQLGLYVRAQVDHRSGQAVVLKKRNATCVKE